MTFKEIVLFIVAVIVITAVICAVGFFCVWLWVRHLPRFDDALEKALKEKTDSFGSDGKIS